MCACAVGGSQGGRSPYTHKSADVRVSHIVRRGSGGRSPAPQSADHRTPQTVADDSPITKSPATERDCARFPAGAAGDRGPGTGDRRSPTHDASTHTMYALHVCVRTYVCVCVYVRMYVCAYACTRVCVRVRMHACARTRMHHAARPEELPHTYVCAHNVRTRMCTHIRTPNPIRTHVRIHARTHDAPCIHHMHTTCAARMHARMYEHMHSRPRMSLLSSGRAPRLRAYAWPNEPFLFWSRARITHIHTYVFFLYIYICCMHHACAYVLCLQSRPLRTTDAIAPVAPTAGIECRGRPPGRRIE